MKLDLDKVKSEKNVKSKIAKGQFNKRVSIVLPTGSGPSRALNSSSVVKRDSFGKSHTKPRVSL